jgi:hypothetical protein
MKEKEYIISEVLANKVLNYIASKPYVEVAQLVSELGQLKEVPSAELVSFPPKMREVREE